MIDSIRVASMNRPLCNEFSTWICWNAFSVVWVKKSYYIAWQVFFAESLSLPAPIAIESYLLLSW